LATCAATQSAVAGRWQRERNVPRSTAARELAYAKALAMQGSARGDLSYAVTIEGHPRTIRRWRGRQPAQRRSRPSDYGTPAAERTAARNARTIPRRRFPMEAP
jgi:hypothetical protein